MWFLVVPSPSMSSSQVSPFPSPSVSLWSGFSTKRQLSQASPWLSLSLFLWSTLGLYRQLSWARQVLVSMYDVKFKYTVREQPTCSFGIPSPSASSSQASPIPSLSASSWPEFVTYMQLSCRDTAKWRSFQQNTIFWSYLLLPFYTLGPCIWVSHLDTHQCQCPSRTGIHCRPSQFHTLEANETPHRKCSHTPTICVNFLYRL